MRRIAIFGGSGATGLCAVDEALKKGLEVRALARNPENFPQHIRSKLDIVQGDVLNLEDVKKTVQGVDAVVIALGLRNTFKPSTVMSDGTKNILNAMEGAGVKKVSACLSAFLFMDFNKLPRPFQEVTKDHQRMLEVIRASSDHDWIAVLPPRIEGTGDITWSTIRSLPSFGVGYGIFAVVLTCFFPVVWLYSRLSYLFSKPISASPTNYEIKYGSSPGPVISKQDLGYFLVDCLDKSEHYHQLVGIAKRK